MWKDMYKTEWDEYAKKRRQYKDGNITKTALINARNNLKEKYYPSNLYSFTPYWLTLELKEEKPDVVTDEKVKKYLEAGKRDMAYEKARYLKFVQRPDLFKEREVTWRRYRTYDEEFNTYDRSTFKCVMPWRFSEKDKEDFRRRYWIDFVDPYCDGRDCTGAEFTSYMRFMRCSDRTVILHSIVKDV